MFSIGKDTQQYATVGIRCVTNASPGYGVRSTISGLNFIEFLPSNSATMLHRLTLLAALLLVPLAALHAGKQLVRNFNVWK